MAEAIVLDEFPKQVIEEIFVDVSAVKFLTKHNTTLRDTDPYDIVMPAGLTKVADELTNNVVKILFSGGVNNKKYLVAVIFYMESGQVAKHEFYVMVQDVPC